MNQRLYHRYKKIRAIKILNKGVRSKRNIFPSKKKVGIFLSSSMTHLIYNLKMELRKGIMQKAFLRVKERFNIMKQFEAYMPNKKVSKANNTYVKRQ